MLRMVLSLPTVTFSPSPYESTIYFKVCGCRCSLEKRLPLFLRFEARRPSYRLKAELKLVKRSGFAVLTCFASERRLSSKASDKTWSIGTAPMLVDCAYRELRTPENGSGNAAEGKDTMRNASNGENVSGSVDGEHTDHVVCNEETFVGNVNGTTLKCTEISGNVNEDNNVDIGRQNHVHDVDSSSNIGKEHTVHTKNDVFVENNSGVQPSDSGQPIAVVSSAVPFGAWDSENSSRLFTSSRFALLLGVVIAVCGAVSLTGLVFGRWWSRLWERPNISNHDEKQPWGAAASALEAPSAFSFFMKKDLRRKETVEWVNMVIGKLWKVYRRGLELWLVGLLQPLIDNLKKPSYVRRVEIKQFNLGDEPLSVRSVERRTSRHANDLQYHIGLRYTGEARMLLAITVRAGFVPVVIPVGVRGLDVDGEVWVKLRLIPSQPWVGTATWAFVSLPKIILALAPFGLFNIMGTPFLSRFLTKLLTVDLPQLFVRPNKIVISFTKNQQAAANSRDEQRLENIDSNEDFAGELSVTIVDARKLKYSRFAKTDPYVVLTLGDQIIKSKKNSQTTIIGPPGAPIWNQDFQMLVVDPRREKLAVRVRDTVGLTILTIGYGEVDLSTLQDTVPTDKIVTLKGGWGPKRFAGEIMLRLTYKAYVEDEAEDDIPLSSDLDSDSDKEDFAARKHYRRRKRRETFMNNLLYAVNATVNDLGYESLNVSSQRSPDAEAASRDATASEMKNADGKNGEESPETPKTDLPSLQPSKRPRRAIQRLTKSSAVLWLSVATGIALLAAVSLNFSNLLNP